MNSASTLIVPSTSRASGVVSYVVGLARLSLDPPPVIVAVPGSDLAEALPPHIERVDTEESLTGIKHTLRGLQIAPLVETHGRRAVLAARLAGIPPSRLRHVFHEAPRTAGLRGAAELLLAPRRLRATNTESNRIAVSRFGLEPAAVLPPVVWPPAQRTNRDEARRALAVSGRLLLGVVGRLEPVRRPDLAIRAAACLRERGHDMPRVVLVGDGPLRPDLLRLGSELGIGVDAVGRRPGAAELMSAFAVLVNTSPNETFGLGMAEAAVRGVPVAAVRSPGAISITDAGRWSPLAAGDPSSLAVAIEQALSMDVAQRERFATYVRDRFGPDALLPLYQARYGAPQE